MKEVEIRIGHCQPKGGGAFHGLVSLFQEEACQHRHPTKEEAIECARSYAESLPMAYPDDAHVTVTWQKLE